MDNLPEDPCSSPSSVLVLPSCLYRKTDWEPQKVLSAPCYHEKVSHELSFVWTWVKPVAEDTCSFLLTFNPKHLEDKHTWGTPGHALPRDGCEAAVAKSWAVRVCRKLAFSWANARGYRHHS